MPGGDALEVEHDGGVGGQGRLLLEQGLQDGRGGGEDDLGGRYLYDVRTGKGVGNLEVAQFLRSLNSQFLLLGIEPIHSTIAGSIPNSWNRGIPSGIRESQFTIHIFVESSHLY